MADKYLNKTGLAYFLDRIKTLFVEKETGKGLSTNDYTTAEKTKLAGVDSGAEENVIIEIRKNGTAITPAQRIVDIDIPVKVSDIANDSGFQTAAQVTEAINDAISDIAGIEFVVTQTLPAIGEKGKIYLVPVTGGAAQNIYKEYIWITVSGTSKWEMIGTTEVDLSDYWKIDDLTAITTAEIDQITA